MQTRQQISIIVLAMLNIYQRTNLAITDCSTANVEISLQISSFIIMQQTGFNNLNVFSYFSIF